MTICIALVYFGHWPNNFDLTIKSIASNASIDFILITDNPPLENQPGNVRHIRTTLAQLAQLAGERLGVPVKLAKPYSLCDLKPMYGVIFQDYFSGYDFWGYCDSDLVLGNLRHFFTPALLQRFDKVLMYGHLSLHRNNESGNTFYKRREDLIDWKKIVKEGINVGFDEWRGIYHIFEAEQIEFYHDDTIIVDVHPDTYEITTRESRAIYPKVYYWQNGSIFGTGGEQTLEYLYVHLRRRVLEKPDAQTLAFQRIYFAPEGFIGGADKALSKSEMISINGKSVWGTLGVFKRRVRRKIGKMKRRLSGMLDSVRGPLAPAL